ARGAGITTGGSAQANVHLDRCPPWLGPMLIDGVDKDRVVGAATVNHAALKAETGIDGGVVITEIVVAIARAHPEPVDEDRVRDGVRRGVDERGPGPRRVYVDRRIKKSALRQGKIPVTGDVDVAARRPAIMGRHPYVAGLHVGPVAGRPGI